MIAKATNLRDQAILMIFADCGCRVSELLAITPADFDLERQILIIPHLKRGVKKQCPSCHRISGKTTKFCASCGADLGQVSPEGIDERTRMVSMGERTASALDEYIQAAGIDSEKPIFPISRQMVYKIVRDAAESIGLGGKVFLNPVTNKKHYIHPHDFRNALAVEWLNVAKGDANKQKALQEHLGHRTFDTTIRYSKLSPSTVRSVGDEVRKVRFG